MSTCTSASSSPGANQNTYSTAFSQRKVSVARHMPALLWFLGARREERHFYSPLFPVSAVLFEEVGTGQGCAAVPPVEPFQGDCGRDAPEPQLDSCSPWCRPAALELREETDVRVPLSLPSVKCTASSEPGVGPADLREFLMEIPLGKGHHEGHGSF